MKEDYVIEISWAERFLSLLVKWSHKKCNFSAFLEGFLLNGLNKPGRWNFARSRLLSFSEKTLSRWLIFRRNVPCLAVPLKGDLSICSVNHSTFRITQSVPLQRVLTSLRWGGYTGKLDSSAASFTRLLHQHSRKATTSQTTRNL